MKKVLRVLSVAIVLIGMVAVLATVAGAASASQLPDYTEITEMYSLQSMMAQSDGISAGTWGTPGTAWENNYAHPSFDWNGNSFQWRWNGTDKPVKTKDPDGKYDYACDMFEYDASEQALTIYFPKNKYQSFQATVNTNENADLVSARASLVAFELYYEAGTFPGMKYPFEGPFGRITPEGEVQIHKEWSNTNVLSETAFTLTEGWNWVTCIAITTWSDPTTQTGIDFYFGNVNPKKEGGITSSDLASMYMVHTDKIGTLGTFRTAQTGNAGTPNQFILRADEGAINSAKGDEMPSLTIREFFTATMKRTPDAFMNAANAMDSIDINEDPAAKYAAYLEAKSLLEAKGEAAYSDTDELSYFKTFEKLIEETAAQIEDLAAAAVEDYDAAETLGDKYEVLYAVLDAYSLLYKMDPEAFPLNEEFAEKVEKYNEEVDKINAALVDAISMSAGVAATHFVDNEEIAPVIGQMIFNIQQNPLSDDDDEE